jgi:hypothetical protein
LTFSFSVRLGEYDVRTELDCENIYIGGNGQDCVNSTSIPIEQIIVHPEYDPQTRRNDIALIRLEKLAQYTGK